jgi:hypothetical protein
MKNSRYLPVLISVAAFSISSAYASQTLLEKDDWTIKLSGFVEFDSITDTTRSLVETPGNTPIDRAGTFSGSNGRTQFSIRNSRFALDVNAPPVDGVKSRGYLEMDFLGYDNSPPNVSEAAFFNNPSLRVRLAFIDVQTENDWKILGGQTWEILGWQPYYFLNTVDVSPLPGQLYGRTTQVHALKSMQMNEFGFQGMIGVSRPPERDSSYPSLDGGLRLTYEGRKSGFVGGATGLQRTQPMSIAVSGTFREIEIPNIGSGVTSSTNYPAGGLAINAMIPIIASSDGKDVSHTLSISGEFTAGSGYGDEFVSWTGNVASPLSAATNGTASALKAAGTPANLDAGIGDFDSNGAFHLMHLATFNTQLQYTLNEKNWFDFGYAQLFSSNVDTLVGTNGLTSNGNIPYNREQVAFVNLFHDFTSQLRVGVEYDFTRTTYGDGETGRNDRYQASAWFFF